MGTFCCVYLVCMVPSAWLYYRLFHRNRKHRQSDWTTCLFFQSLAWPVGIIVLLLEAPRLVSWIDKKVYDLSTRKTAVVEIPVVGPEKARTELDAKYKQRAEMAAKHRKLEEEIGLLEAKAYPLR